MKKILIVTSGLTHGGVNKALLNLLNNIDHSRYDVDVFSLYQSGPYRKMFSGYSMITMEGLVPDFLQYDASSENNRLTDLYIKVLTHLIPDAFCKKLAGALSKNNYDAVIAFQEGFTTYLCTFIPGKKHIAWIHCDYERYMQGNKKSEKHMYEQYDHIVAVSEYTAKTVKNRLPSVADKVVAIYNAMDSEGIISMAREAPDDDRFVPGDLTLVSIGRMDPVKRFSQIPAIAREMKDKNISFCWYIIGDGGLEKKKVVQEIARQGVQQEVILLGMKNNPYSYLKHADLLVCPSQSEACPNVVNEARILHVPVVAADFPSAKELIENGANGYISPINEISQVIETLYFDKKAYKDLCSNIEHFTYENKKILQEIYKMLNC